MKGNEGLQFTNNISYQTYSAFILFFINDLITLLIIFFRPSLPLRPLPPADLAPTDLTDQPDLRRSHLQSDPVMSGGSAAPTGQRHRPHPSPPGGPRDDPGRVRGAPGGGKVLQGRPQG